ncbi:MAG TPA: VOC family protein, partial [Mycobacterium sp.]|nr:VOC family protein [Mycobacterium sp.]
MDLEVIGLSVDCADAAELAMFWSELLGRPIGEGASAEYASIPATDQGKSGPRLTFHRVPEPKTVKNRLHLDLITNSFPDESARVLGLGATKVRDVEAGQA